MTDRLRELAGKIDKASKRRWVASEELVDDPASQVRLTGFIEDTEGWVVIQVVAGDEETVTAIIAARNEAPALLRDAADEIERLKRVVDQVMDAGGFYIDNGCIRDIENEFFAPVKDALDLAEEIQQREAQ